MPNADDTTIKTRAYSDKEGPIVPQSNLTEAQDKALELVKKTAQLEDEKKKSLEHLKAIEQLREYLKQEQAKTAEMAEKIARLETRAKELAVLEENQLAKKNAQLEEAKSKSLEQSQTIEQLKESLKQEQAKAAGMEDKLAGLEAKAKEMAAVEAKVKELTEALGKISAIAATGKVG